MHSGAGAAARGITHMYHHGMRTIIELKPEHRAKLLEIAARRGEKEFSSVVAEAVESYLARVAEQDRLRLRALRLRGVLRSAEAERLRREAKALRERWR